MVLYIVDQNLWGQRGQLRIKNAIGFGMGCSTPTYGYDGHLAIECMTVFLALGLPKKWYEQRIMLFMSNGFN